MCYVERERGVCVGCDDSVFIHILEAITLYHIISLNSSFFVFYFVFFKGEPIPCVKKKLFVTVNANADRRCHRSSSIPSSRIPTVQPPPPPRVVGLFPSRVVRVVINKNTHGTGDIG